MKYNNNYFIQLSREIFNDEYKDLSINAKWLFVVLNELEHRFTNRKTPYFWRSNDELVEDTGMSLATLKRAKAELIKTPLIKTGQGHYVYTNAEGKECKSQKRFTWYQIMV